MKRDFYTEVTARIVAELEAGAVPWVKPWSATAGRNVAANAVTNRPYGGINVCLLWGAMQAGGYTTPRFLTFKQALEAGGHVLKGEHGHKVVFVKKLVVRNGEAPEGETDDAGRTITMLREYTVFNVAQCDGLPDRLTTVTAPKVRNRDTRDDVADAFMTSTGARLVYGGDRAFYATGPDSVTLPEFRDFRDADNFYSVAFHELTHWTGATARCNRVFGKRFGDRAYAAEELVAELGAAFLCAEFSFDGEVRHAGYIATWIDLLKSDKRAIFTAAAKAQQAADYMRGLALAEPQADAA